MKTRIRWDYNNFWYIEELFYYVFEKLDCKLLYYGGNQIVKY